MVVSETCWSIWAIILRSWGMLTLISMLGNYGKLIVDTSIYRYMLWIKELSSCRVWALHLSQLWHLGLDALAFDMLFIQSCSSFVQIGDQPQEVHEVCFFVLRSRATMKNKYTKTLRVRDSVDMVWVKLGNGLGNTFPLRSLWTFLGRFHRSFQVSNQFGNLCRPSQKCVGEGLEAIKLLMLDG